MKQGVRPSAPIAPYEKQQIYDRRAALDQYYGEAVYRSNNSPGYDGMPRGAALSSSQGNTLQPRHLNSGSFQGVPLSTKKDEKEYSPLRNGPPRQPYQQQPSNNLMSPTGFSYGKGGGTAASSQNVDIMQQPISPTSPLRGGIPPRANQYEGDILNIRTSG